jgi:hypothetical protein
MEAEIKGHQRKVIDGRFVPTKLSHGTAGIPVRDGRTLPFKVIRRWSAPAGHYNEQWFIVDPESREVLYESRTTEVLLMGLQAPTTLTDEIGDRLRLKPGKYLVVYALDGISGGEFDVEAVEVSAEAA